MGQPDRQTDGRTDERTDGRITASHNASGPLGLRENMTSSTKPEVQRRQKTSKPRLQTACVKSGEVRPCGLSDTRADRQTDRQTDRSDTILRRPPGGEVATSDVLATYRRPGHCLALLLVEPLTDSHV